MSEAGWEVLVNNLTIDLIWILRSLGNRKKEERVLKICDTRKERVLIESGKSCKICKWMWLWLISEGSMSNVKIENVEGWMNCTISPCRFGEFGRYLLLQNLSSHVLVLCVVSVNFYKSCTFFLIIVCVCSITFSLLFSISFTRQYGSLKD